MPAPIIHDSEDAVEDAAGSFTTTKNLVTTLIGEIEKAQDLARRQREQPIPSLPEALDQRLSTVWNMAEVISERMNNDCALLYAIVETDDKLNEELITWAGSLPPEQHTGSVLRQHLTRLKWADAIEAVEAAIAFENEKGVSEEETERRTELTVEAALKAYAITPPNWVEMVRKAKVIQYLGDTSGLPPAWGQLLADMEALAQPQTIRGSTAQEASPKQA